MIDVHRLRVFRAVVASGSVQAAATNLGYTPSAISQQLSALQRETGLTLFAKDGRGIRPTPAGRVLADQSEAVMAQLSRLNGVVDDLRAGRTETLTVATFASAGEVWLPLVARELRGEFPDLQLTVNLSEIPGSHTSGAQINLRTEHPGEGPTSMPGYTRVELCEEDYVAALSLNHPLAQEHSVTLADLSTDRWISDTSGDEACARILRAATQAAGFSPRYAAITADHHASIAFAAAGIGVAVLPLLTVAKPPSDVAILRICDPAPRRRIVAFVLDAATTSPAVRRTVELLRSVRAG